MTYKEFKKNLADIEKEYDRKRGYVLDEIDKIERALKREEISEDEAFEQEQKQYSILEMLKGREKRSVERLKMNFARQDAPAKIGDIIWAFTKQGTKLLKVTDIRLASFEYPMLKYFGIQMKVLTGLPAKVQKQFPNGGIFQKDITSVNGEPYTFKVREY